ncbi:MAG: Rpn family recombination-promoting nuclease/putative transposase [Candidatus Pedobacter colombiensis]|uniref:Rpn family recombination-promoting nuclease/putative transposase n=1 Tax=Candidatus Pedobacter colombiensis TaxID=3121371 RepID=A0AAJ5WCJ3_9SPHI|nr:Rpn family recombination-promoting nuclease/putative transposase [Pedobacter sp.]WEK20202.1 MAG: Rpn family recombination-promoting nuclease/putative transposase [Pedobacter sp.]
MSEETGSIRIINPLNKKALPRYIDPYSDFGFKHIFGKAPNKNLLINFINQVLIGRKVIVDIQYNNIEFKGSGEDYRKTVLDLHCTGDKGEKFMVEMQKAKAINFKDRSIFYTANLIQEQGIDVAANWNYEMPEIFFIGIMNFNFDDSHPDHFIHDIRLMDNNTHQEFYSKLSYTFIEMPKFTKLETELKSKLDEWLYILNNLKKLSEIPLSLVGNTEYEKVFELAEVGNLTREEMCEYNQRLKIQRDNYSAMEYVREEGHEKGVKEGIEIGLEKGIEKGLKEVARKLKVENIPLSLISKTTGLTKEEIEIL